MPPEPANQPTIERILALHKLEAFRGLGTEDLTTLAGIARERFFPAGSVLLRGESPRYVYTLLDGSVRVERSGHVVGRIAAGRGVGLLSLLARDPTGVDAIAETDVLALESDADAVLEVFEDHFTILSRVLQQMAGLALDLLQEMSDFDLLRTLKRADADALPREPDLVERILILRRASPFVHGSVSALAELSQQLTHVTYPPGVRLWEIGEPAGSVLITLAGSGDGTLADGRRFEIGPGLPLGAMESLAERPRWYSVTTRTRLDALHGSVEALSDVFEDNPDMAFDYLAVICRTIVRVADRRSQVPGGAAEPVS